MVRLTTGQNPVPQDSVRAFQAPGKPTPRRVLAAVFSGLVLCLSWLWAGSTAAEQAPSEDWPQWGGDSARSKPVQASGLPVRWDVGQIDNKTGKWQGSSDRQIRWVARLGSETYGSPVVAGGKVFCATNNGAGYLPQYPAKVDLGCLLCFRASDGQFLWQHSAPKLKAGQAVDWPEQGICCCPLVEGDRAWLVNNRGDVVCLKTDGNGEAQVVWLFDMMRQVGSIQRYMCSCSVTAAENLLFACTGNGIDLDDKLPAPEAPSFIALDKNSGALVWADRSPGANILEGQWSSPAYAVLGGVPQVIFAGGDGWLYAFQATGATNGKPQLLWKFDCNPKDAVWEGGGSGRRNHIVSTPVIHDGRVYVSTGQDPEAGEGPGDLWCVDPTRRGDVSPTLVVDKQGQPVPPRRLCAVDQEAGETVRPNPNSAVVWHYAGSKPEGNGKEKEEKGDDDFSRTMHRTLGMVAIRDGLLVIGDFAGLVHCLDAKTGRVHWTHDMLSQIWGSGLIADGKIYLGTEEGDVVVFALSSTKNILAKNNMGASVYGTPVVADNRLYIATRKHLFAIAAEKP